MASLKWTGWCGIAGAAIVATLFLLPQTRWVTRLHALAAGGKLHRTALPISNAYYTYSYADILNAELPPDPTTVDGKLLRAEITDDGDKRRAALDKLSDEYPENAFVQAELGRYESQIGISSIRTQAPAPQRLDKNQARQDAEARETTTHHVRTLAKAASRGEAADPENAHFSILAAVAAYALGDERQARAALMRAAERAATASTRGSCPTCWQSLCKGISTQATSSSCRPEQASCCPTSQTTKP